jgi:leader peptidase (prepilin peptidase) / N-methyltransferase
MDLYSFMALYSILLGLALGSFVNVCIYRIPNKKSIISPPSTCPNCGQRIKFYDNIPLISYALLLGRCRNCRKGIPLSYPAVELLVGLMSLALFTRYGLSFEYFVFLLFVSALITISLIDLRHKIIPDVLSLPGVIAGFSVSLFLGSITWLDSLIGILSGGGSLFLVGFVYKLITGREGMGGGDVKLLAMIGAWMGWRSLPFIVLISSLTGAVIGFAFILLSGKGLRFRIPFGPFLSLGALLYLFFGADLTTLYFRLLG